jgi:hypothetical protein
MMLSFCAGIARSQLDPLSYVQTDAAPSSQRCQQLDILQCERASELRDNRESHASQEVPIEIINRFS